MDTSFAWWTFLCAAAAVNIAAWSLSARLLSQRAVRLPAEVRATRQLLLWLSAIYVLGCAFRSFLPMVDVPRICLHDSWISRIVVGRSVATVAELAFAAQWAILLREAGAIRASRAVLPVIGVAELFSWMAVLTTNNLYHAVENSLWTVTAAFAAVFMATRWRHESDAGRRVIAATAACAGAYVAFMVTVDVPMYLARWQPEQPELALAEGWREILARCSVNPDWSLWREDALWLSLYFTFAVWMSIALPHLPPLRGRRR